MQAGKAVIRKAAPSFKATAWWQGKFQEISLEQFRGKYTAHKMHSLGEVDNGKNQNGSCKRKACL